jgi:3-oxoacyl-(acyl-carrier-protein) synthase
MLGLRGHSKTVVCDRASGLVSVALAARAIADGECDLVLAGGSEAPVTPFAYLACMTDGLVATGEPAAYRPFDLGRSGLIPGEGAAFVLLEAEHHAVARGAHVYASVAGAGMTNDACHPAPLPPEERGLSEAMEQALANAGLGPEAISLVVADGIADRDGDRQEAEAVSKVFGTRGADVAVTAPKSATGHLYGAAGALDVVWAALAIEHGVVPPTPGVEERDPACDVDVRAQPWELDVANAMVNGRGSGGINSSLVLST